MRISEILEATDPGDAGDAAMRADLSDQFDAKYADSNGNKLPQFRLLDKASIVSVAVGYDKRPDVSSAMAIKYAVKQLYPDFETDYKTIRQHTGTDKKDSKVKDSPEKTANAKTAPTSAKPKTKTPGANFHGNQHTGSLGGRLNPMSGIDNTSIGKAVGTAFSKAKSNMRNLDSFRIKK